VDERIDRWRDWGLVSALDTRTTDGERSYLLELVDEGEGFLFSSNSNLVVTIRDDDTPLGASRWISGAVDAVHPVPGGRWLLSGTFDRVDGVPRPGLARFGADGIFDPTFRPPDPLSETAPQVAVDASGRVLVAGSFPAALDPAGVGLIRLTAEGDLDPTFQISSGDQPLPNCHDTPNQIAHLLVDSNRSIVVAGTLPRFSNCRTPSHVVRISPDGLRTGQWILPDGLGQVQQVLENRGGLMAMSAGGLVRLEENGQVSPVFEIQNHSWARFPLNAVPWPDGTLWVEASSGELMRVQPFRPMPIHMEILHDGQVLKPRQWSAFHRRGPDQVLAAATFMPTNDLPQPVVPLLLVVDASGTLLRFSEIPPSDYPWSLKSLAVDNQGVIAGVSDAWRGGLKWWRFSPDLSPVADLTLEAAVPADGGAFLRLKGQAPRGYSIEVSDDLQSWRPGSLRPEIHWGQTFLEPDARHGSEARYYRARF